MISFFLNYKTKNVVQHRPTVEDIKRSKKILFALFTRYGDTVIDLVVIKKFIDIYPDKEYWILCPRQMKPYVRVLLSDVGCLELNKRNWLDMYRINRFLRKKQFDIGFNPWSNGIDSCFFVSYCKKFLFYKDFERPDAINHYEVVRKYLQLPAREWRIRDLQLNNDYKSILLCPQSTDTTRSISNDELDQMILKLSSRFDNPRITIASMDKAFFRTGCHRFLFEKNQKSSVKFLRLVGRSDLLVCSDSGPLHIASALGKHLIAIFRTTSPEIVVNSGTTLKAVVARELFGSGDVMGQLFSDS